MTATHEIVVHHEVGLHARPAATFVRLASEFSADVEIQNLSKGRGPANAKSMLGVLSVGVAQNDKVCLSAVGEDEQDAVDALVVLIESDFKEEG